MAPLIEIDESMYTNLIQLWLSSNEKPINPDYSHIRTCYNAENCMRRKYIIPDYMQFLEDTFNSNNDLFYKIYKENTSPMLKNENIRKHIYSTIKYDPYCDVVDCFCYEIMKRLELY